jgi:hypothetical protein
MGMNRQFDRRRSLYLWRRVANVLGRCRFSHPTAKADSIQGFELDFLQCVAARERAAAEPLDARYRTVDNSSHLRGEIGGAILPQALFRLLRREPSRISLRFFRRVEPEDFAEMSFGCDCRRSKIFSRPARTSDIARKRSFLDAAMDPRFLDRFQSRGLSVRQSRLDAALRKGPALFAAASLYQQKFDAFATYAITDRRNLHPLPQSPKLRNPGGLGGS